MHKKSKDSNSDPYSSAIKSLVKKTVIALAVLMVLGAAGLAFVVAKSGLKIFPSSKKSVAAAEIVSVEKIAAIIDTSAPTATPDTTVSPSPSPFSTVTPVPSTSSLLSPTPSNTPQSTSTPTPKSTATATASPQSKITTIKASAPLDGYIDSKSALNSTGELRVGSTQNATIRSFLSFDISKLIPSEISKAKLRVYQTGVKNDPFISGADIRADYINFGSTLDSSDYSTSSLTPSFAILSNTKTSGWKEVEVTESIQKSKQSGLANLQFRLHFNFESEGADTYALFESADNSLKSNNLPELVVELK